MTVKGKQLEMIKKEKRPDTKMEVEAQVDLITYLDNFDMSKVDISLLNVFQNEGALSSSILVFVVIVAESVVTPSSPTLATAGLRAAPNQALADSRQGHKRLASAHNDKWAIRRDDFLQAALNWTMSVPLGDLPLRDLNELFAYHFTCVVKVDKSNYLNAMLMNTMNVFNQIIQRTSGVRSLRGRLC